ncbi:hypothetical protein IT575_10585 [bacterium]|nr:hypothetical protein [bacterium]
MKLCLRQLARLLALVLALQAGMPRELVWCCQKDGDIALELAHGGRCLGLAGPGCGADEHQHTDEATPTGPLLAADLHGPCEDIAIVQADSRQQRWGGNVLAAPRLLEAAALSLPAPLHLPTPAASSLEWQHCQKQRSLQRASTVLRI